MRSGKAAHGRLVAPGGGLSQWSLTFEVRKSELDFPRRQGFAVSQWSLTFEVRKSWDKIKSWFNDLVSQWSLTFEVRKRTQLIQPWEFGHMVAMEPDL